MADKPPPIEFGKRRPAPLLPDAAPTAPTAPTKRSRHVSLLMFGAVVVGSTAYFHVLRQNCQPPSSPGMAAQALPQTGAGTTSCTSSGSGHSSGVHGRYNLFGGDSSPSSSSAGDPASGHVSRGGFGSFAHAFGFGGG